MKKVILMMAAILCIMLCMTACKKPNEATVTPAGDNAPTVTQPAPQTTVFTGQMTLDAVLTFSMTDPSEVWAEMSRYNHTVAEDGSWVFDINDSNFKGTLTAKLNDQGVGETYILSNGSESIDIMQDSVSDYVRRIWDK